MHPIRCDALIFDFDGVLVDTTPCIERQMRRWAARHNLEAEAVLRLAHGRRTTETIRLAAPHLDAEAEADDPASMQWLCPRDVPPKLPAARDTPP